MSSIELPEPETDGSTSVERTIATRASRRSFARTPVELSDVAQLLWAAQGITHRRDGIDMRAAPSAGATYPLETFLETNADGVDGLDPGLFRYDPGRHVLERLQVHIARRDVTSAAFGQEVVRDAPAILVLAADYDRTRSRYPEHGERYVHMEAGHASENVHLQGEALRVASCPVGAFRGDELATVFDLPEELEVLYLVPFGYRRSSH